MMIRLFCLCLMCVTALARAEAQYDIVVAGGTEKAVSVAEENRRKGLRVCVLAPRNYLGEDTAGTLACLERGLTPLEAKRALDERLIACGADFLTGVFVTDVALPTVTCAGSRGVFTLRAEAFLDCRAASASAEFSRAARIVVAGTPPAAPGMTVLSLPGDYTTTVTNRVKEDGDGSVHIVKGRAWRCEFDLPFAVTDAVSRAQAELFSRARTWSPDLLDGADELIPLVAHEATSASASRAASSLSADVVVVGGGVAGAPAAIAAARAGAKTILVESLRQLGGMGTAGGIGQYWQGYRDGFTAEYDQRIRDLKPAVHGIGKRETWRRLAEEAGVTILWGCPVCDVVKTGTRLSAVKAVTDYGQIVLSARVFVDATGNANLAAMAGAEVAFLEPGPLALQGSGVAWRPLGVGYMNTDWGYVNDSSVRDSSRFLACGRIGAKNVWDISQLVGSRERRHIIGDVLLTDTDMARGRKFADVIVCTRSNFDSHGPTGNDLGLVPEPNSWLLEGVVPYRALLPRTLDNVLVVGLGLSATRDAFPIVRMQSDVQNTGYAAGYAAAMVSEQGGSARALDVKRLQRRLVRERRLPEAVFAWTDRDISDEELAAHVRTLVDGAHGVANFLAARARALPLVKKAYADETRPIAKFRYAHVLGILGEDDGAALLADWLAGKIDVPEPDLRKKSAYARRFGFRQSVMIALGRTKSPLAVAALRKHAQNLSSHESFFPHRAVCWAVEATGSRELGEILREKAAAYPSAVVTAPIRPKAGYSTRNHFMTDEEIASLKALDLATAVFRLTGDASLLKPWLSDAREVFRLQAMSILGVNPNQH